MKRLKLTRRKAFVFGVIAAVAAFLASPWGNRQIDALRKRQLDKKAQEQHPGLSGVPVPRRAETKYGVRRFSPLDHLRAAWRSAQAAYLSRVMAAQIAQGDDESIRQMAMSRGTYAPADTHANLSDDERRALADIDRRFGEDTDFRLTEERQT